MDGLSIRLAEEGDLAKILAVERASAGSSRWSEAVWRGTLSGDEAMRAVFVAEREGELLGYVVGARVAAVAEIEGIAVAQAARRQGVARSLCVECMRWARAHSAERMELEVRASSAGARELYGCLGFVEQGRRRGYYQSPVEDAVLMTVSLVEPDRH